MIRTLPIRKIKCSQALSFLQCLCVSVCLCVCTLYQSPCSSIHHVSDTADWIWGEIIVLTIFRLHGLTCGGVAATTNQSKVKQYLGLSGLFGSGVFSAAQHFKKLLDGNTATVVAKANGFNTVCTLQTSVPAPGWCSCSVCFCRLWHVMLSSCQSARFAVRSSWSRGLGRTGSSSSCWDSSWPWSAGWWTSASPSVYKVRSGGERRDWILYL